MEKIQSFRVDHTKIGAGIYVSRIDGDVTTYDMRFKRPNMGDYLDNIEMHSVEHMFATYVRNSEIGDSVRNADNNKVLGVVIKTLENIINHSEEVGMFGASEIECGNYRELSLESAKQACRKYLEVLKSSDNTFEYAT